MRSKSTTSVPSALPVAKAAVCEADLIGTRVGHVRARELESFVRRRRYGQYIVCSQSRGVLVGLQSHITISSLTRTWGVDLERGDRAYKRVFVVVQTNMIASYLDHWRSSRIRTRAGTGTRWASLRRSAKARIEVREG